MRHSRLFLLLIFLFSCNQKNPVDRNFDLIDVSIDSGRADLFCFKVYSDGQFCILNDNHHSGKTYFKINLGSKELDSLNTLSKLILNQQLDTLYEGRCADCGAYNIIIKSKNRIFHSQVDGKFDRDTVIITMNRMVSFLHTIAGSAKSDIDSFFYFESRTKRFFPVPPPPWKPDYKNILTDTLTIK